MVPPMRVADKSLAAPGQPLHRPARVPRRPQHHGGLAKGLAAQAEATADIQADDTQLLLRHFQDQLGQAVLHAHHALGRAVQGVAPGRRVVFAQRDPRFHRVADQAVVHQFHADHVRRADKGRIGPLLPPAVPMHADVAAMLGPDHRGARLGGGGGVGHARQFVVVHLDQLGGVLRLGAGLRHHQRHGVADEADVIGLQYLPWWAVQLGATLARNIHLHRKQPEPIGIGIRPGQHQHHAGRGLGRRHVHPPDPRIGVGAAQDEHLRHAGAAEVVRIGAAPGQQPHIFLAAHRLANAEFVHLASPRVFAGQESRPARECREGGWPSRRNHRI